MKFTDAYLELSKQVQLAKYKIVRSYEHPRVVLNILANLRAGARVVEQMEREAGNTVEVTSSYGHKLDKDPREALQFEINQVFKSIDDLEEVYSSGEHRKPEALHAALGALAETHIVPLFSSPAHLADFLNASMEYFIEYTNDLEANSLEANKVYGKEFPILASDVVNSVTEEEDPFVIAGLKGTDAFIKRLYYLNLGVHATELKFAVMKPKDQANDLADIFAGKKPAPIIKTSNIF